MMGRFRDMSYGFFRKPKNKRSLKSQLFSSFGFAAFVSLFLVVITSCFVISNSGKKLIDRSQNLMDDQVRNRLLSSSELFVFAGRAQYVEESLEILVESVRDRLVGYPTMEGWETGKYVPFESEGPNKQRVYPLNQPPVPFDWQISRDIDVDGIDHPELDQRLRDYPTAISSTKTAHYYIPGRIERNATTATGSGSDPNANISSSTEDLLRDDGIYRASGDLSIILKTTFEHIPEALTVEIQFFNGGTGSILQFPATATKAMDNYEGSASDDEQHLYQSQGCEWMTTLKNPYTGKQYASETKCPPPGSMISSRLRNPMDSDNIRQTLEFTSSQFLNINDTDTTNPSKSNGDSTTTTFSSTNSQKSKRDQVVDPLVFWSGPIVSSKDKKTLILAASKAIYDRVTSEFVGVVTIEILETGLNQDLQRRVLDDESEVYLTYAREGVMKGAIIGRTPDSKYKPFEFLPEYGKIEGLFNRSYYDRIPEFEQWKTSQGTIPEPEPFETNFFTPTDNGGFLVSVPVPPVPRYPWDFPLYSPSAFVVQIIPPTIFRDFDVFANRVRLDVKKNIILCVLLGIFGLLLVLFILAAMSKVLSQPLTWIMIAARKVINTDIKKGKRSSAESALSYSRGMVRKHNSKRWKKRKNKKRSMFSETTIKFFSEDNNIESSEVDSMSMNSPPRENHRDIEAEEASRDYDDGSKVGFVNFDYDPEANASAWCTLSTELQQLLEAFQSMIHKFSGDGVSEVAEPGLYEIQNVLTWCSDFSKLYEGHAGAKGSFKKLSSMRQISGSTRTTTVGSLETEHSGSTITTDHHNSFNSYDQPTFRSSDMNDKDAPGELASQSQQDDRSGRIKDDCGIKLPGSPLGSKVAQTIVPAPIKVNWTSTLGTPEFNPKPICRNRERPFQKIKTACSSRLFWWIVVLMALPVFITNSIIGAIVSSSILVALPTTWKESAKQGSNKIEKDAMQLIADRKAAIISNLMRAPARDLYILTRTTNWLIFGGIERSNTSTSMDSTSEDCKGSEEDACPFSLPCSCDWDYGWNITKGVCGTSSSAKDSRYRQQQWFEVQKTDSDPVTGSRRSSPSFPASLRSPESTVWWENISDLPGSEVGYAGASGYKTLYDRVVVSSASAVFSFPIFNYPSWSRKLPTSFGGHIAFAEDGLLVGWSGCNDWHSSLANFVSTYENGASLIDEDLCANGKYGYDPRCRGWYAQGRESYLRDELPALISPPYEDILRNQVIQTITSPIANPKSGEYVGQVALDFKLDYDFVAKLLDGESSLTFMITPHEDILGGDTVVGPGSDKGRSSAKIEDLIFTNEPNDINRNNFEKEILPLMKAGERGNTRFLLTNEDGVEDEICLYYTPVKIPLSLGVRPDDFTVGPKTADQLIYSLGVGKPCDEIKRPYDGVEDAVNEDILSQQEIFIAIIVLSTVFFVMFSVVAAIQIAFPMIKLSNIVHNTKKGEYDSIPPLEGGCKEVRGVYSTFAKLNKIVKISNTSFFSGKLDLAHHFVSDALVLYRKINDRKAIGVTCNNLANTLFAIQYEHIDDVNCCDETTACYVNQTLALYDEAMSYSQQDFDEAEGNFKVEYAIQLADRLFNRGLYFLFIDGYDCAPCDSRDRGYNDITFSRNLHDDVRDYLIQNKQLFAKASTYFSRLLRRINCLAAFYDDVGLREIWDARVLLNEAKQLFDAATEANSKGNFCPLFQEASHIGRRQQLERLEILLALNCGENLQAARIGMRMLVEDSYLMESAFVRSAEAILCFMNDCDVDRDLCFSERSMECIRNDFRSMVKSCKKESLEIGKNAVFALEICPSKWETTNSAVAEVLEEFKNQCFSLYDSVFQGDDQVGMLADILNSTEMVEIGSKRENEGRQRAFIDIATSMSNTENSLNNENPSSSLRETLFPKGLQMLIDSSVSLQSDSYILWVTNGCGEYEERAITSMRDQIELLNQERSYAIHVLIIDLNPLCRSLSDEGEEELMGSDEILLGEIGNISKNSIYLSVNNVDELISAFEWTSRILSNDRTTSEFISFLTMEKF